MSEFRYFYREIGEGKGWKECPRDWYDYCSQRPEYDTKEEPSNPPKITGGE